MTMSKRFSFYQLYSKYGAIGLFIILIAVNCCITDNFISISVVWNIIIQGMVTLITALGMALAISSSGIDLSVGSVMPIAGIACAKMLGFGIVPAMLVGFALAILIGLFNGFFIGYCNIQPFIVTLAMYMSGRGIAQAMNKSMILNFTNDAFTQICRLRIGGEIPVQLLYMPVIVLIVAVIVKKTVVGRHVQAVGDNRVAARLSGISVGKTMLFAYGASAMMAGMAGMLEIARVGAVDPNTLGSGVELDAITAVVLGGTPMSGGRINIAGTIFAALVVQLIVITMNMNNISAQYALVVKAVILAVSVIIQQHESTKK